MLLCEHMYTHMCHIADIFELLFGHILKNKYQTLGNMPKAKQVSHSCSNQFIQR